MPTRRALITLLLAAALPGACASTSPTLYAIQSVPGVRRPGASRVILLRPVGLARYLDRQQIVRSAEDYRLDVSTNDWWGEPLGSMLTRVLVEELSQRLPSSTVFDGDGAITIDADLTVEVNVRRLDATRAGAVILMAQVAVTSRPQRRTPASRAFNASVPQPSPDLNGFVAAASAAVGHLADVIAEMVRA